MNKPALKLILFCTIGYLLILPLNWLSLTKYSEDLDMQVLTRGALVGLEAAQALTAGGSGSQDIDFASMGLKGVHLFFAGGDLFEAEAMIETALKRPNRLRYVFVSLHHLHFIRSNGANGNRAVRRSMYRVLARNGEWRLIDGDWRSMTTALLFPLVRRDRWRRHNFYLSYLLGWRKIPPRHRYSWIDYQAGHRLNRTGLMPIKRTHVAARNAALRFTAISKHFLNVDPGIWRRSTELLLRLDDMLAKRNIKLVLFEPPITDIYASYVDPVLARYQLRYEATIIKLQNAGIEIFRGKNNPTYSTSYGLFYNGNHLNINGARLFSADLKKRLQIKP